MKNLNHITDRTTRLKNLSALVAIAYNMANDLTLTSPEPEDALDTLFGHLCEAMPWAIVLDHPEDES